MDRRSLYLLASENQAMLTRIVSALVLTLAALGTAHTHPLVAQGLPRDVITVAVRHVVGSQAGSYETTVLETDRFPNQAAVRDVADVLGLRAGRNSDLVQCSEDHLSCRIVDGRKRLIRLLEFDVSRGNEVRLLIVISKQVELPGEAPRLFPELREITLSRTSKGVWEVTDDQLLVHGG